MVEIDACVSWSFDDEYVDDLDEPSYLSNHDCCLFTLPTTVKNCGDFRVYHIGPTQACSIAYCSAPKFTLPNSTSSPLTENTKEDILSFASQVCLLFQLDGKIEFFHIKVESPFI